MFLPYILFSLKGNIQIIRPYMSPVINEHLLLRYQVHAWLVASYNLHVDQNENAMLYFDMKRSLSLV